MLTHQFILSFLQATEHFPEDMQRELFSEIIRGHALSPPPAPIKKLEPLKVFRSVDYKPRKLLF